MVPIARESVKQICMVTTPQALKDYAKTADIRREFFKNTYPAATGIVVHSLLSPEWLIEIDFLAVLD